MADQPTSSYRRVCVAGATGYIGSRLAARLVEYCDAVRAIVRPRSLGRLPHGVDAIEGDALDATDYARAIGDADTVVHLIGTPHPGPAKAREFVTVDLASVRALTTALRGASQVAHVIYLSVAQPAPVMRAYVDVRIEGERLLRESGIPATFVRPWYVLGPGHRWPMLLIPLYAAARAIPFTRETATRLGLVSIEAMVATLMDAVVHPPASSPRIVDVTAIRAIDRSSSASRWIA